MSLTNIFIRAVTKAQHEDSCHNKLLKLVENAFIKSKTQELLDVFLQSLYKFYYTDYCADKSPYIARGLEFLAKVVVNITLKCVQPIQITEACGTSSTVYDITLDPFFNNVLNFSLKFAFVEKTEVRFNTCYFIMTLLQNIGNNVEMDQSICNIMVDSLVDLLHDNKANVRLQAIKALVRLQEPSNPDCLVLRSFWTLFSDPNMEVRKTIINLIATHPQSFSKIKMSLTDKDPLVRQEVYMKFAEINPKLYLKIVDRNLILTSALADPYKKIQNILTEKLLPKWLSHFGGNYLLFFRALRLDADENDINNFEQLCSELLDIFLKTCSLTDIVKYLPVNKEDKLIPIQDLRLESVLYWSGVISYLRTTENGEDYLEEILPELTSFSNYIEKVVKEKYSVAMDEWENLEFQNTLHQLFKIASGFDMSDEVGRKTFYSLILQILTTHKFHQKVIDQILKVASLLSTDKSLLCVDLCQVISEIREPLVEEAPSEDQLRQQNFGMTLLKVKLHQLEIDEEEALKKKDFQLAHMVHNELEKYQKELDSLKNKFVVSERVRVSKDDPETLCKCLDILIGVLKIIPQNLSSPALQSCRDEFLMPLLSNKSSEVHWRFMLCLGLFSLLDKDLAFKHANILCLPIATYRTIPNYDKLALKTSVACVSDLIRYYGVEVIGIQESAQSESSQTTSRRKLYTEDLNELEVVSKDDITMEIIIDIIVDMIDDEDEGVRSTAICSLCKLIRNNFPVTSELIGRLILKWYHPETEKRGAKFHQMLGTLIECFAAHTRGAKKIVQRAIVPIISSIANASATSPLLEIDIDNVLKFLAVMTNSTEDNENIHNQVAADTVERMLNKPNDNCTPYLVKLLTYLDLNFDDTEKCKNLLTSTESLLSDLIDKIPMKYLAKFRDYLQEGIKKASNVGEESVPENETNNRLTSNSDLTKENAGDQSLSMTKSVSNGVLHGKCNGEIADDDVVIENASDDEDDDQGNSSETDSEGDTVETQSEHEIEEIKASSPSKMTKKIHIRSEPVSETSAGRVNRTRMGRSRKNCSKIQKSTEITSVPETKCEDREKNADSFKKPYNKVENVGKAKTKNVEVLSQIVLRKRVEENSTKNIKISRETRSKNIKNSSSSDSSAINSPLRSKRRRLSNSVISPRRTPTFSSRYQDYMKSIQKTSDTKGDKTPIGKQVEKKRIPETPLSVALYRKSKRLSRANASNETPSSSTKDTQKLSNEKTPSSVENKSTEKSSNFNGERKSFRNFLNNDKPTPNLRPRKTKSPFVENKITKMNEPQTQKNLTKPKDTTTNKLQEKIISDSKCSSIESSSKVTKSPSGTRSSKKKETNIQDKNMPLRITRRNKENNTKIEDSPEKKNPVGKADKNRENKSVAKINSKEQNDGKLKLRSKTINMRQKEENETVISKKDKVLKNQNDNNTKADIKSNVKNKQREKCDTVMLNTIENTNKIPNNKVNETFRNTRQNSKENRKEQIEQNDGKRIKETMMNSKTKHSQKIEIDNTSKQKNQIGDSSKETMKNQTKPKDKRQSVPSVRELNNGVLKNLNNVMNDSVITRRSPRISIRTGQKISSRSLTRTRVEKRPRESLSTSKKKLDCSTSSDETILRTFLQGDEVLLPMEDMSAENISSFSSSSTNDSKKENLSIIVSTSSSSSRRSTCRKRGRMNASPNKSISPPKKKKVRTANKRY